MVILDLVALFGALSVIWLRLYHNDRDVKNDLKWILSLWCSFSPWSEGRWLWKAWTLGFGCWYHRYGLRQRRKRQRSAVETEFRRREYARRHGSYLSSHDYNDDDSPMKPVIFPCRTSHTRLFPKKHSFSYSYLFVGIPVGWRGYINTFLSADLRTLPWSWEPPADCWFDVDSSDYLARGDNMHGLRGKLDDYLESQREKTEDYPYAYLVTAPRFLGYSFNPVSFWYLYDIRKELKAMILEVNNTFDEKRMYFLKSREAGDPDRSTDVTLNLDSSLPADLEKQESSPNDRIPEKFTATWQKDFHVSPFNSRKGGYSLSATDPFVNHLVNGNLKDSCGNVNNTILLSSSKDHPKLIARIFSTSKSLDPYLFEDWQALKFVLSWWWVGLITFPRILREAGKLFFARKLHVWFRPEVLKDSIGRNETHDERAIASLFRDYLESLVESSDLPVPVQFISGIATMPSSETFTPRSLSINPINPLAFKTSIPHPTPLSFKPTTPLFYALLARQHDLHSFFKSALEDPDPKTATFHTSNPDLLLRLFGKPHPPSTVPTASKPTSSPPPLPSATNPPSPPSPLSNLLWNLLPLLRTTRTLSPLDAFAYQTQHIDGPKSIAYRHATFKLLLSDRIAFGVPGLIDAAVFGVRMGVYWIAARYFEGCVDVIRGFDGARWVLGYVSVGLVVLYLV